MSSRKHTYSIYIFATEKRIPLETVNDEKLVFDYEVKYNYAHTKDICIALNRDLVRIQVTMGTLYDANKILSYNGNGYCVFPDAIKKAALLYLLMTKDKPLSITPENMVIYRDGTILDISSVKKSGALLFSIAHTKLSHPIEGDWYSDCEPMPVSSICNVSKSKQDGRFAALNAVVWSKTKTSEAEKFLYLWIAFNGLYGYVKTLAGRILGKEYNEKQGIQLLLALLEIPENANSSNSDWSVEAVSKKNSKEYAYDIIRLMESYDVFEEEFTKRTLSACVDGDELKPFIDEVKKYFGAKRITPYGYFLCYFSYFFRCELFHASKPLPLFSFYSEYEMKCLHIINQLLEEYLDTNLAEFFINEQSREDKIKDIIGRKLININN